MSAGRIKEVWLGDYREEFALGSELATAKRRF